MYGTKTCLQKYWIWGGRMCGGYSTDINTSISTDRIKKKEG